MYFSFNTLMSYFLPEDNFTIDRRIGRDLKRVSWVVLNIFRLLFTHIQYALLCNSLAIFLKFYIRSLHSLMIFSLARYRMQKIIQITRH